MPRKQKTTATADKTAQPQIPGELLQQLIPAPVTPAQFEENFPALLEDLPDRRKAISGRKSAIRRLSQSGSQPGFGMPAKARFPATNFGAVSARPGQELPVAGDCFLVAVPDNALAR